MRAEIFVHRVPIETPVETSFGIMRDRPSLLIRIEDDDGCTGWGEVWCNFPSVGAEHRARLLAATILPLAAEFGALSEPGLLWTTLTQHLRVLANQTGEHGPIAQCLAGLECALQDLAARRQTKPLYRMLTKTAQPLVNIYASGINPTGAPQTVARAIDAGHVACKIKVGFDPEIDRQNLAGARQILGDERTLMADANQGWSRAEAVGFAEALAEARLAWLEEPLLHDAPDADWQALANQLRTPLAAGENFSSDRDFECLPERRGLKVLQPDLGKWGGVARSLDIGGSAARGGYQYCPHWLGGGVGLLTTMHVKAATRQTTGYVEVDFNPNPMRERIAAPIMATLDKGQVQLPDNPGIGVEDTAIAEFSDCLVWRREVRLQ